MIVLSGFIHIFMDVLLGVCIILYLLENIDLFVDELGILFFVECLTFLSFGSSLLTRSMACISIHPNIREYA